MRGAEADDLHVDEACLETDGADVGFGDGFLAFRVHDPESRGALDLFRYGWDATQICFFANGEKNPGRTFGDFVFGE